MKNEPSQPVAQDSERERLTVEIEDNIVDTIRMFARHIRTLERENEALRAHIESVKRLGREWLLSRTGESIEPRDAGNAVFAALNRTITPEGGRIGDGENV